MTRLLHRYHEFTSRVEYAYDYGMPQQLARVDRLLSPLHLERLFLGRHKFYHFRVWYRDWLATYLKENLLDPRSVARPYLRPGGLERVVTRHVSGRFNYTSEIHQALTLELICRRLLESN